MKQVALISNGDYREAVGVSCWPKQEETLRETEKAFGALGVKAYRAHPFHEERSHGFITTQAEGCRVFSQLNWSDPVVLVLSSWVWASHVASSLKLHGGPILLIGNFDGTWPGLVSLLNHSASFQRMNIKHARMWTDSFSSDRRFMRELETWVQSGSIVRTDDHVTSIEELRVAKDADSLGRRVADNILSHKRILGQMDPGCMGMLNAVMSPDRLAGIGMPLELLNQSDLLAEMDLIGGQTATSHLQWLKERGTTFHWGNDPVHELTEKQVLEQMKMYEAAGRIYRRYGLSAIGIPYQYGLVRCTSASDLPEGMLNNAHRPDIMDPENGEIIEQGLPIVHFNEGDVGSAVPQVLMRDILLDRGMPAETTLHDVRWGDTWDNEFIWVFEVSGGAPPAHWGGWENTHVYRQPAMYFPRGGGTCSGVSKPGAVTWARFYEAFGDIGMDVGTGRVVELPADEVKRRQRATTGEWPMANVVIPGYDRDRLMSTHRSNHITLCYGSIVQELAAAAKHLGVAVSVVGEARKAFS
jgi:L-fucose isomerase-like protein